MKQKILSLLTTIAIFGIIGVLLAFLPIFSSRLIPYIP